MVRGILLFFFLALFISACAPQRVTVNRTTPVETSIFTLPPEPTTNTPDPRVIISIGTETFRVTNDVLYSEMITSLNFDPLKVQVVESEAIASLVKQILWYRDEATTSRCIWNEHIKAWVPEFTTVTDYDNPEISTFVPIEAYYDGSPVEADKYIPSSATLSDLLYIAEHPGLISPDASYPHYRVTLAWSDVTVIGYQITLTGPNQYLLIDEPTTQISYKQDKPFQYFGLQHTMNKNGEIIYIIKKANWNPTGENHNEILPTNMGFDKEAYEEWFQYPLIHKFISNEKTMPGELTPIFPYEFGVYRFNENSFYHQTAPPSPHLAALLYPGMITMFDPSTQQDIKDLYKGVGKQFDASTNPGSKIVESMPSELSNGILYTAVESWRP